MTDEFNDQDDLEWQRLGLANLHLQIARTIFDSPAAAQPWSEALTQYAPNSESLRAIVAAGVAPHEFMGWRAAGARSGEIVRWSELSVASGLSPDHLKRWRSAGHDGSTLMTLVLHLSTDVTFEDLLAILTKWSAPNLIAVLESGIDINEVVRLRHNGNSGAALDRWRTAGIPAAAWKDWIAQRIDVESAVIFSDSGIDPATAKQWQDLGLQPDDAVALIAQGVTTDIFRPWLAAKVAPAGAVPYIRAGVPLERAREWIGSEIPASDAVDFIRGNVDAATATEWLNETELSAYEIIDFIQKEVSLEQALELGERGIESHQLTLTETGLESDLYPWQVDPIEQLPNVLGPGKIELTLWTDAFGDGPQAYDVRFNWDGHRSSSWYSDISMQTAGLSVMSSSPGRGMLAWPNGRDVYLTYRWLDFSVEGHDVLADTVPLDDSGGMHTTSPSFWISLGYRIIEFVLQKHGSGDSCKEYLDKVDDVVLDLDEMFEQYLLANDERFRSDFRTWLEDTTSTGRYRALNDSD